MSIVDPIFLSKACRTIFDSGEGVVDILKKDLVVRLQARLVSLGSNII